MSDAPDVLQLNCEAFAAMMHGDKENAERLYRAVLGIDPDNTDALRYLGEIIGQSGRSPEAIPYLRRALEKNPALWATWCDLGQALQTTAQTPEEMQEGLACTMTGTRIAEKESGKVFAAGRYNQGLGLVSLGDWERGWANVEWGYPCGKRPLRTLKGQLYKGEKLKEGESLFVYWEGGYGDTFFWVRYLPALKAHCEGRIILEVQRALKPLFDISKGAHCVADSITVPNINDLQEVPDFTYRLSLGSIPYRLGMTLDNAPYQDGQPYLYPSVAPWPIGGKGLKVGIVWKGNPKLENDKNRSTTEEMFKAHLGDVEGVQFYSLQYEEKPRWAQKLPIKSYVDTAAMIKSMDLLITVDTSVAHVAGAMGKECWIGIPFVAADFRWGIGNSKTRLYPSWTLFRQQSPGDWDGVFGRIREQLAAKVAARKELALV